MHYLSNLIYHASFGENDVAKNIYLNISSIFKKLSKQILAKDIIQINVSKLKILILKYNDFYITGVFTETTDKQYAKLLLNHVLISMINLNINLNAISNELKKNGEMSIDTFKTLKIYEIFLVKPDIYHFTCTYHVISVKEEMNLNKISFKNMYIIDLLHNEIVFNLQKCRYKSNKFKYHKIEKLWNEIVFISKNLKNQYFNEQENNFTMKDSHFRVSIIEKLVCKIRINIYISKINNNHKVSSNTIRVLNNPYLQSNIFV